MTDSPPPPPTPTSNQGEGGLSEDEVERVRQEAWERIEPHLEEADKTTQELTDQYVERIENFFEGRKEGAQAFAEAALSWTSKWEYIKSFKDDGAHREFLAQKFEEYIFTRKEVATLLEQASVEYAQGLQAARNQLLVKVRADLRDLPDDALPAFASEEHLTERFDQIIQDLSVDVARDFKVDVGREAGSLVVGEVVAAVVAKTLRIVAVRLGISGSVLSGGTASSWATFGAGLVIAIAADYVLDWIISWFHDPVGDVTDKVEGSLDNTKDVIINGIPEAWTLHDRLDEMASNDPVPELRSRAAEVSKEIERGGTLGLKYMLKRVADVHADSRERALHQLVYGDKK